MAPQSSPSPPDHHPSVDAGRVSIREFAEQVLFATSLEQKLAPPGMATWRDAGSFAPGQPLGPTVPLTDHAAGHALATPAGPGRPSGLRLQPRTSDDAERADFPREHELREEKARGRLLHFLCNHELLAAELMALALLKFPEAPRAFRQGLVHTLQEEQRHTLWYLQRMAACGVSFGDYPVNRFFWEAVSSMSSPLDYVARLPLTFEQANLDFSLYYARVFSEAGDEETAALLRQIHDDEIGHVGYGLRWLRKLKEKEESDYTAWARHLSLPLSPVRGKGKEPLDLDGRRRAGLEPEWVRQLELATGSKGRTPVIHWFNPGAEALAAGREVDPVTQDLTHDAAMVMALMARSEDVLVLPELPTEDERWRLRAAGISLPEILTPQLAHRLGERKLGGWRPWALTGHEPAHHHTPVEHHAFIESLRDATPIHPDLRPLYGKGFGADLLRQLGDQAAGLRCSTEAEVMTALTHWQRLGHQQAVMKSAFGLAGRGQWRVNLEALHSASPTPPQARQLELLPDWIRRALEADGEIVVEPWLERVADFSVQCEVDPPEISTAAPTDASAQRPQIRLKGITLLQTSPGGQFQACVSSHRFSTLFPLEVGRYINQDGRGPWLLQHYQDTVLPLIAQRLATTAFRGALGIDAFIYRLPTQPDTTTPAYGLRSIVEINPRHTMGRIALEGLRFVSPHRAASLTLLSPADAKRAGFRTLKELADHLTLTEPPQSMATADGRSLLDSGAIILNNPDTARRFLTVLRAIDPSICRQRCSSASLAS